MLTAWTEANAHFSTLQHQVWLRRRLSIFGRPTGLILHNPSVGGGLISCIDVSHGGASLR